MKNFTSIFGAFLLVAVTAFCSSCKDDKSSVVPTSIVSWSLTLPSDAADGKLSDVTASFKNVNTGVEYTDVTVTTETKTGTVVTVSATLPEGLYHMSVEGRLAYMLNGEAITASVRAYKESVTVSGTMAVLPEAAMTFYSPSNGFVIEEIFFAGTTTPTGDPYSSDQYFKIYNNSDHVLYADSLALLESEFLTVDKQDYTPNMMPQAFTIDFLFMIPGSGKDVPVQPGKSLLIALEGIDHREYNSRSFDLSKADFEFYDVTTVSAVPDVDNPTVPNLDKWYSYTRTFTGLHNRGFKSYALAKMNTSKENYLKNYIYTAEWLFVFNEFEIPQSADYFFVPNSWIVDAVNLSVSARFEWIVTDPSLDAGWSHCGQIDPDPARYNKSVRRKVASTTSDGRKILMDTNNSTVDFDADATPSLLQ